MDRDAQGVGETPNPEMDEDRADHPPEMAGDYSAVLEGATSTASSFPHPTQNTYPDPLVTGALLSETAGTTAQTKGFLELVLVHFMDVNGVWLHSGIFQESMHMMDVEAALHMALWNSIDRKHYFKLVWLGGRRGPYPSGGQCGESFFSVHENLNGAEGLYRTDDRQVFITCVKTPLNMLAIMSGS